MEKTIQNLKNIILHGSRDSSRECQLTSEIFLPRQFLKCNSISSVMFATWEEEVLTLEFEGFTPSGVQILHDCFGPQFFLRIGQKIQFHIRVTRPTKKKSNCRFVELFDRLSNSPEVE